MTKSTDRATAVNARDAISNDKASTGSAIDDTLEKELTATTRATIAELRSWRFAAVDGFGVIAGVGTVDAVAVDVLIGLVEEVVATLSRVAQRASWSDADLRETVDDLTEQRIVWTHVHQHSKTVAVQAFTDRVYEALGTRPWWTAVSAARHTGTFAEQLARFKQNTGWTLEHIAERVGIDKSNVFDHLHGNSTPRPTTRAQYEKLFSEGVKRPGTPERH